jgi:hypothetical protein
MGDGLLVASLSPRWLPLRRATRRRVAGVLKVLLGLWLVFGLLPGAESLVASAAQVLHDEVAHDEVGASDDGDCDDHGCSPLSHQCTCCASASALAPRAPSLGRPMPSARQSHYRSSSERGPPNAGVKPALRPPIA